MLVTVTKLNKVFLRVFKTWPLWIFNLFIIHLLILCSFLTLMKLICCFSSYLSLFLFSLLCGVLTVHTVTPAFYLGCSIVALILYLLLTPVCVSTVHFSFLSFKYLFSLGFDRLSTWLISQTHLAQAYLTGPMLLKQVFAGQYSVFVQISIL